MKKGFRAAVALGCALVLSGCSSAIPTVDGTDPVPDEASTVASGIVRPQGEPYAVEGLVGVEEGCVVIIDPDSETSRLAVWPVGTQLTEPRSNIVKLANGEVSIGELIEPSRGYIVTSEEVKALLLVEGNSLSGWNECESVGDEVVILSYVKDFAQQE
ncbi:YgdI/YgdR family lipoprotein [Cryobacterium sp. PAMC25264]|uniref:YgdI/YgdR family lipoprotein n=1 Tax=Cryobacterium sp. PAMC25264 TaxID=2861288 RepID=UPI001C639AA6|nr:YgdI/YgdR family lipoprotein [Cryobacterium sp. PAMC25264]QYF74377.1 YgdI/YgdR family lipoprotein [Cryobacterium sp. PAMC25264]